MFKPRICVSLTVNTCGRAIELIHSMEQYDPDLIELRLDYLETLEDLDVIRDSTERPLIATNRRLDQGGRSFRSENQRIATLLRACDTNFDYVDLELTTHNLSHVVNEVRERGSKLIISYHDFHKTLSEVELEKILEDEYSFRPNICKIVGNAETHLDNLTYLKFLTDKSDIELVCFAMGRFGAISRVLSPIFGGKFTYASVEPGLESAPGQLTIRVLKEIYRMLGV